MVKRKSLIVYFRNPKALKKIADVTEVTYYTKKKKYAVVYVNEDQVEAVTKRLQEISLVRKIEESLFETEGYQLEL